MTKNTIGKEQLINHISFPVISFTKIFLQPNIEADKQIPTAHFINFKLSHAVSSITPCNGNRSPGVPPYNGLERQLNSNIEVRRQDRLATINHLSPISFECIGRVIQAMQEQHPDKSIGKSIK